MPKYGYLPTFHGRDQVGILDSLPEDKGGVRDYFLILEPMGGIPTRYLSETIDQENSYSSLTDEVYFGELRVQQRLNERIK